MELVEGSSGGFSSMSEERELSQEVVTSPIRAMVKNEMIIRRSINANGCLLHQFGVIPGIRAVVENVSGGTHEMSRDISVKLLHIQEICFDAILFGYTQSVPFPKNKTAPIRSMKPFGRICLLYTGMISKLARILLKLLRTVSPIGDHR